MKRLIFAFVVTAALSLAAFAQTPPPPRPAANNAAPAASAPAGGTGAEGKLAYLNSSRFRDGITELKDKIDALNKEFEPKKKEVQALEDDVNNLKNKINTQGPTVSAQVRAQWVEEGTEKERKLKRLAEDYEALGQKRLAEAYQPVSDKIMKFLDAYCQQRGIVMVMEGGAVQQTQVLLWASAATDITDDFMKEFNKSNTGGAAAPKK
ncbi:MAG TPA: OmpH family outer membrane protein [Blastocatellia bacterium]|nr:OmpH family outer membrane protein [Blastocatellia bacterium]HMV83186.1 OmpH family outer membrane protein [Blastocatellia bacterium]HMX28873.1 OmpH family outer membrane protein [Blastocatellia bacterium]HMY72563.1 OmpH family outer membrane protein [Blastocatellia bacterium]HMZ20718.1 OmpH family outer membrane protein [Blastocatellia bacterium]